MTSYTGLTSSSSSGIDVTSTVEQLMYVERAPARLMQKQQSLIDLQKTALQDLLSKLNGLEDSVMSLKDFSGPLNSKTVTSSDTAIVTASASATSVPGTQTVVVERLATVSSLYTDPLSADADLSGAIVLKIGSAEPLTITLDAAHRSPASAAEYINGLKIGVKAQVIEDTSGIRLALISEKSGATGDLVLQSAPDGLSFQSGSKGEDAKVVTDGVPIYSASNSVQGVVPGVTLELSAAAAGKQVRLSVTADSGRAKQAIKNFVNNYNTIVQAINAQFAYDGSKQSAGVLAADSSLRGLQSSLLSAISYQAPKGSAIATLKTLGIDMQDDGKLAINDSILDEKIGKNANDVLAFFQGAAGNGFANQLGAQLNSMTDSIDAPLAMSIKGLDETRRSLSDAIDDLEVRLQMREQALTAQYVRLNTLLQQFTVSQQQMAGLFGTNSK